MPKIVHIERGSQAARKSKSFRKSSHGAAQVSAMSQSMSLHRNQCHKSNRIQSINAFICFHIFSHFAIRQDSVGICSFMPAKLSRVNFAIKHSTIAAHWKDTRPLFTMCEWPSKMRKKPKRKRRKCRRWKPDRTDRSKYRFLDYEMKNLHSLGVNLFVSFFYI